MRYEERAPAPPVTHLLRSTTSGLCAEALNKLGQRHAMLELNEVVGHGPGLLGEGSLQPRRPVAQWMSLAEVHF